MRLARGATLTGASLNEPSGLPFLSELARRFTLAAPFSLSFRDLLPLWTGVPAPFELGAPTPTSNPASRMRAAASVGRPLHSLPGGPRLGITLEPSFQCAMRRGVAHYINVGSQCPFL
jgi:hypothetical protein